MTTENETLNKPDIPSRRTFLSAMGATVASLNTAACIRKPYEKILPFGQRPEDRVPGRPEYYATAASVGASVVGLRVRSNDGRPTFIGSNKQHPTSKGGTPAWAQATVLELYDPDRSRTALMDGASVDPAGAAGAIRAMGKAIRDAAGRGLAILTDETPSPTLFRLMKTLKEQFPEAQQFRHDEMGEANGQAGAAMAGIPNASFSLNETPAVIAIFDADPMGTEGDTCAFDHAFASGRDPDAPRKNRLYVVEPYVSLTGSNADHRKAVKPSEVPAVLAALASELNSHGYELPKLAGADAASDKFVKALAKDMAKNQGVSMVMVGERQPPQVHALAHMVNAALGAYTKLGAWTQSDAPEFQTADELVAGMKAGTFKYVVSLSGNPAHSIPGFADAAEKAQVLHLGSYLDETARIAKLHVPKSHYLEAWGDLVGRDGSVAIQQPLIAPLHESKSAIEVLATILGSKESGYEQVRDTHRSHVASGDFEKSWQVWLHDGVVQSHPVQRVEPAIQAAQIEGYPKAGSSDLEAAFIRDLTVLDGRFANSPWLQELPDPVTKLSWDNALLLSPDTAEKLGLKNEDMATVTLNGASLDLPVWIQPGTADDVAVLPLGYGREGVGQYASSGFDVSGLRPVDGTWSASGVQIKKTPGSYRLACQQLESDQYGRPIVREASQTDFTADENFVAKFEVMKPEHIDSLLWEEPVLPWAKGEQHQWAVSIDLNKCSGCSACVVACQAENNIPWVGKSEVLKGREMHWMKIDRYFKDNNGQFEVKYQPMGCAQCETAPCENVCPVGASAHSPEGLNDMAYNRCIGTRYCANNCPYKVRRFNFFHYTVRNDGEYGMGITMQRNPDVTVRYRGVMEKCTYCVQRIQRAKIYQKVNGGGDTKVKDGAIVTACEEACGTGAMVFGNMADPESRVAKMKNNPRNYAVLAEINIRPRTTYLAKLTNPNPELAEG
ncbi:MAG: 4Fe-4S dicluster domain-containing protein [Myxococcota bacterium]